MKPHLSRLSPDQVEPRSLGALSPDLMAGAAEIVNDVRDGGDAALREHAVRLGDLGPDTPMVLEPFDLRRALDEIDAASRGVLERTAESIRAFAQAQKESLKDLDVAIEGGRAGHRVRPVRRAGCYAPGGRYPLPSSVLMTAVPARVAGVDEVWVASPRPGPVQLAAAAVAGVDHVLAVGGAQAIAALAFGTEAVAACDVVVGPGNRWVTAAKQLVAGHVGIDMLAGPSELLVVADRHARAELVAADLLAQAEHDPDARVGLVALDEDLVEAVEVELSAQLAELATAEVARASVRAHGFAVAVPDLDAAIAVSDRLAPEHLQLHLDDASSAADRFQRYGAIFVGASSAEVAGDYGAGPNHTLPTGGTARFRGGLGVLDFMAVRTWLELNGSAGRVYADAGKLADLERLDAHAKSARLRLKS